MSAKVQPWDQQAGEPDAAYKRFLIYLGLGHDRTLLGAYRRTVPASEGVEKRRVPGSWHDDSREWNWVARADAFDIYNLRQHGSRAILDFIDGLATVSRKTARALRKLKPKTWAQCLDSLHAVGAHLTPEDIAALASRGDAAEADPPADGPDGGPHPVPR